ncbi:hypothetical protein ACL9RL_09270 [Plantibacter sp. Mn2098]|uniref:hypothetical protein n=1 Tax=Plantibacter sp. Mn2098 TaxID=3395266 RepID=UPI003BC46BC0
MPEWIQDLIGDVTLVQVLLWVALVVFFVVVVKKAWKPLTEFVALVNALKELPEFITQTKSTLATQNQTLATQNQTLAVIKHEVLPNSGGSMRDQVDRIKHKLDNDNDRLDGLDQKVASLELKQIEPYRPQKGTP